MFLATSVDWPYVTPEIPQKVPQTITRINLCPRGVPRKDSRAWRRHERRGLRGRLRVLGGSGRRGAARGRGPAGRARGAFYSCFGVVSRPPTQFRYRSDNDDASDNDDNDNDNEDNNDDGDNQWQW